MKHNFLNELLQNFKMSYYKNLKNLYCLPMAEGLLKPCNIVRTKRSQNINIALKKNPILLLSRRKEKSNMAF